ncbi:MAG: hypothetical protein OEY97_13625 [Nitrospirota bacterium]|nr:hypothetical protein [Nitrospirota bacterium]
MDLLFRYQLAEHLHMPVSRVMGMSVSEYLGWQAYFKQKGKG